MDKRVAVIDLEELDKPKVSAEIKERTDQYFAERDKFWAMLAQINMAAKETHLIVTARMSALQDMIVRLNDQLGVMDALYFLEPKDKDIH